MWSRTQRKPQASRWKGWESRRIRSKASQPNIFGASAPPDNSRKRARDFSTRRPGEGRDPYSAAYRFGIRRVGKAKRAHHLASCNDHGGHGADAPLPTLRLPYLPIAKAIRPSVPTMTRHHANSVKPWRVT